MDKRPSLHPRRCDNFLSSSSAEKESTDDMDVDFA